MRKEWVFMKILTSILLALVLSCVVVAQSQGQNTSQSGSQGQSSQTQNNATTTSGQNMSGTVSHDRKTVMNDKDKQSYKVDNPDALKGKQDQHVALVVQVDPDNNVIHVIQVQEPQ
jgi:uncharacterized protein YpmS